MLLDKKILVFLTVAEAGSYSKATRLLSLGQSVLSHHVDLLEKELGVTLFKKKGRSIALTQEGEILFKEAQKLQKAAQNTEDTFSNLSSKIARNINLAGDALTCAFTLPWALAKFRDDYPDVRFTYKHMSEDEIISGIISGDVDLALVGHNINNKKLVVEPCFFDDIILVGSKDNTSNSISLSELQKLSLIWITSDKGLEHLIQQTLSAKSIPLKNLNIFMEVEDLPTCRTFVQAGVGCAFLPRITVKDDLENGILKEIKVKELSISRTNFRTYLKNNEMREVVMKFLEFIQDVNWEFQK
jgi:LysR family transcriptional regulator, transcriptional activator of the cysJI operon